MMTTLAALFGAFPLALETGAGSELRFPLGITIIGGVLLSPLLALYTKPVVYLALDRLHRRLSGARLLPGEDSPPGAPPGLDRDVKRGGPPPSGGARGGVSQGGD